MALGEPRSKRSDDILDIMLRQKFNKTNITFKSIADLRRKYSGNNALQLIKSYQEKIDNTKNIDHVSILFGSVRT